MSIIKSIKQVLGLSGTASENHFWDGSVPNQLSLKRGTPDAPGAELIKALNGALSFPNQGQSLTSNGYVKLPGGLIVQWGNTQNNNGGGTGLTSVDFPVPFTNACLFVSTAANTIPAAYNSYITSATGGSLSVNGFNCVSYVASTGAPTTDPASFSWIAIGY